MAKKVDQPKLSTADIEILRERIRNMSQEEQEVVASVLNTSIMDQELRNRHNALSEAFYDAALGLRRIKAQWVK